MIVALDCVCAGGGAGPRLTAWSVPLPLPLLRSPLPLAPPSPLARATAIEELRNKVMECQQAAAASGPAEQHAEEQGEAAEEEL